MNGPEIDFRALYEAQFQFVWCSLRRLGVPEADALDSTQKVFLTAHVKLPAFEGRSSLRTWLFGICQRVASDYRRSAPVRREVVTDITELDVPVHTEDLVAKAETQQRAAVAEAILNKLSDEQRAVFVLFELEEQSGQEIADLLGISLGTVRSRLRLAREIFQREVKRLEAVAAKEKQR